MENSKLHRRYIAAILAALIIGGLFGRESAPTKVVEKRVEVVKKVKDKKRQKNVVKERITQPSGVVIEREIDRSVEVELNREQKEELDFKIRVKDQPKWHLGGGVGIKPPKFQPTYLVYGSKQFIGPFSLGAFASFSSWDDVTIGGLVSVRF